MNRKEIKAKAKEFAFENKWNIWKPYLIIYAISFAISLILSILGLSTENTLGAIILLAVEFAMIPLSVGYMYYLINLVKGKKLDIKEALLSKYKLFILILVVNIVVAIITSLWTLLLIIPGIIYSLKVSMVNYILADTLDEKVKFNEVINQSKELMKEHLWDYFVFGLSFIGWILLTIVTCGIAIIWVYPYITVANIMYYEELKKINNN